MGDVGIAIDVDRVSDRVRERLGERLRELILDASRERIIDGLHSAFAQNAVGDRRPAYGAWPPVATASTTAQSPAQLSVTNAIRTPFCSTDASSAIELLASPSTNEPPPSGS
jgi:hypothetical protein